jgi:hypothetical protein
MSDREVPSAKPGASADADAKKCRLDLPDRSEIVAPKAVTNYRGLP